MAIGHSYLPLTSLRRSWLQEMGWKEIKNWWEKVEGFRQEWSRMSQDVTRMSQGCLISHLTEVGPEGHNPHSLPGFQVLGGGRILLPFGTQSHWSSWSEHTPGLRNPALSSQLCPCHVPLSKSLSLLGLSLLICKMGGLGLEGHKENGPSGAITVLGSRDTQLCCSHIPGDV